MLTTFEQLESRLLLTATAGLRNGTLTILGDGGDDVVQVIGTGSGSVDVMLDDINDGPISSWSGVTNIVIRTRGGLDRIDVFGVALEGNLNINSGGGADEIFVQSLVIQGSVRINSGAGNDTLAYSGGEPCGPSAVTGNVSIKTGAGDDQAFFSGDNIGIGGNLTVQLGSGNDLMQFSDTTVFGATTLRGGAGFDTLDDGASTNTLLIPGSFRGFEAGSVF
ncbi:MAG: hypothetical protein R3C01_03320 [Planctomycetaceae bacterium]